MIIFIVGLFIGAVLGISVMCILQVNWREDPLSFPISETSYPLAVGGVPGFLMEVEFEVERARKKFPSNEHLLAALMEEVGELAKAHLENEPPERTRGRRLCRSPVSRLVSLPKRTVITHEKGQDVQRLPAIGHCRTGGGEVSGIAEVSRLMPSLCPLS